ncbi:diguanylate cyclase [Clostridium vincentii]|uniref:Diguanylate cyclase DosC n=1 Tax=Clostridium vincentii TaxID=52704 RepID=A0A2T0BKR1_9CLOT|nr:diguanylate cyclase [Clostridium vincentii]PRR84480.1 Diguanylate cyclase DosC [Clostridium vincentii]
MKTNKIKKSMNNLGTIIKILLFLIVIITLGLNLILNNIIISKYFSRIENGDVILSTNQSSKIFQSKIKELERITQDYAFWDEHYSKVQEVNIDETWYKENFTEWLPDKNGIDLIVILNRDKKIIVQNGLNNINEILNDNNILKSLNENEYNEKSIITGFKMYDGEIYMISECPIFKNTTEGNCHGVVILGKKVSSLFVQAINEDLGSNIFITYENGFVSNEEISEYVNSNIVLINENKNNPVYKIDNLKIIGSLPIIDISDNNIGYMNVIQSRDTFLSAQKLLQRNSFAVMILSALIILILGFRFKGIIVNPIKNLENQIKSMKNNNLLIHVNVNGTNEVISLAGSFNDMVDKIYEHKKENQELKVCVNTDCLTSLYNHRYYFESIKNKLAEGHKQIAVMFCDIDKFKLTNDTYGHEVGDYVLIETSKIIKDEVKDMGMVFRYGGEEFVVMMCDYTSEEALIEAEKIRKRIAENQDIQKYSDYFPITISIGIAFYPKHALDAEGLIKKSDTAMYYSKQNGRNQCNIYNENMNVFLKDDNKDINRELLMDSVVALAEAEDAKVKYTGEHSKMV